MDPTPAGAPPDVILALITELARKTSVSWLRYGESTRALPAWHLWSQDALVILSGGDEQPLPGLEDAQRVEVTMRSKSDGGRLITWMADASRVSPGDDLWVPTTAALASARLNVADLAAAPTGWAGTSWVTRLVPTGETLEDPGHLLPLDHRAVPPGSPASTRGPQPWVLHRRILRQPPLS